MSMPSFKKRKVNNNPQDQQRAASPVQAGVRQVEVHRSEAVKMCVEVRDGLGIERMCTEVGVSKAVRSAGRFLLKAWPTLRQGVGGWVRIPEIPGGGLSSHPPPPPPRSF